MKTKFVGEAAGPEPKTIKVCVETRDDGAGIVARDEWRKVLVATITNNGCLVRNPIGEDAAKALGIEITRDGLIAIDY